MFSQRLPSRFAALGFALLASAALAMLLPSVISRARVSTESSEAAEEEELGGPAEAHAWRTLAWRDSQGNIPPTGLMEARQQILEMSKRDMKTRGVSGWRERGPYNVPGRTRSFLVNPADPNQMLMGSVGGGIWRSTDQGVNWQPVNDRLPNLAIACMAYAPTNPQIVYAGTGEGFFNSDAIAGSGVFKSEDFGLTWNLLPATTGFGDTNRVAVSPTNPDVLLAATKYSGIRRSTDGGASWTNPKWVQAGHQVVFHPTDGNKAVAAVLDHSGGWFSTTYYSEDAGMSWTESAGLHSAGFSRIELAYAPSSPNIVFANHGADGAVYKSLDGGKSFSKVTTSGNTQASWYNNGLWVDPTNPNLIIATGTYAHRSTNGGVSFSQISDGYILTNDAHPDVHLPVPHPGYNGSSNKTFYLCTDGGVFRTSDISTVNDNWTRHSLNARTTQFYGVSGHGPSGRIIGGTQDNGTLLLDPGNNNAVLPWGGDGGWCEIDPTNANRFYGEYVGLRIWRDYNGPYIYEGITDVDNGWANFIAPFILDPNSPNVMLAGGRSLWRSTNVNTANQSSVSWSAIKPSAGDNISAIAVAPGNSNVIWVGHNDGKVYRTVNGTAASPTWTTIDNNVSGTNPLPDRYVGRILIDPADSNKVYIALGGFAGDNLWLTTNGGGSFSDRTGSGATGLPSAPIRAISRHPNDANLLHVGTEVGICESGDGGLTWSAPNKGPVNVSVDELRYMSGSTTLLAATHGRGIWTYGALGVAQLSGPPELETGENGTATVTLDGIAGGGGVDVTITAGTGLVAPATVNVPQGARAAEFVVTGGTVSSAQTVTLTAEANGTSASIDILVTPPPPVVLGGITLTPSIVPGGAPTAVPKVRVTLQDPAPTGGLTVNLSSSHPAIVGIAPSVWIAAGKTFGVKKIAHAVVSTPTDVTITASVGSEQLSAVLTVDVAKPHKVKANPFEVFGGKGSPAEGTVILTAPAPAGGLVLDLSSTRASAANPTTATVTVPAGAMSATFSIAHFPVDVVRLPNIKAAANGISRGVEITVKPPELKSFTLSRTSVKGGSSKVVTGTLTLQGNAPAGGTEVALTTTHPGAAAVPPTVTIPAGSSTATFVVTHSVVASSRTATITATAYGVTKNKTLTINP